MMTYRDGGGPWRRNLARPGRFHIERDTMFRCALLTLVASLA
jgi:hypothetical protein